MPGHGEGNLFPPAPTARQGLDRSRLGATGLGGECGWAGVAAMPFADEIATVAPRLLQYLSARDPICRRDPTKLFGTPHCRLKCPTTNFQPLHPIPTIRDRRPGPEPLMKILHISESDIRGGAARAAYRLHRALRDAGLDSRMRVQRRFSDDWTVMRQPRCGGTAAAVREQVGRRLSRLQVCESRGPLAGRRAVRSASVDQPKRCGCRASALDLRRDDLHRRDRADQQAFGVDAP